MEGWGMFRYLLPALGGGFGVYFLDYEAGKAPNRNSCNFGWGSLTILFGGAILFSFLTITLFTDNPPDDGLNDEAWLIPTFIILSMVFIGYSLRGRLTRIYPNVPSMTKSYHSSKKSLGLSSLETLKIAPLN